VIIADTSALLAFFDGSEPAHAATTRLVADLHEPLVVSPYVVAELGYLTGARFGVDVELTVLTELTTGAYELPCLHAADLARAVSVIDRYRDQWTGVTDASIVVLADRYRTRQILTLDHRHFDVLRPLSGGRFTLLP
jgi:predicted nucleic acid-binding protein